MKKPKAKVSPELRRWAIEQAMKWPQVENGCQSNIYTTGGVGATTMWVGGGIRYVDADIISRAQRLLDFVMK